MSRQIRDTFVVYQIIKRLSTPFKDTDAFKAGLIDDSGNFTKTRKDMTSEEKSLVTTFDVMIFNIKKLLAKLPGGDSKIRNFATALWLLKEDITLGFATEETVSFLAEEIKETPKTIKQFIGEEGPTVSIGAGAMDNTVTPVKKSKFGNCQVYHVSSKTFSECRRIKGRYERFMKTLGEGPVHDDIREYAKRNPKKSIMLHDEKTGAYTILKLGKDGMFS